MSKYFDGTTAYIEVADNPALTLGDDIDFSGAFGVAFWLRSAPMNGDKARRIIAWGASEPTFQIYIMSDEHASAGKITAYLNSGQSVSLTPSDFDPWNDGAWHHFAIVGDGTTLSMYQDGIASVSTVSMATLDAVNRDDALYLGRVYAGTSGYSWAGDLAEMAKFGALTPEQIAALASGVRPVDIGTRPDWYLPMCGDLHEAISDIAVTNNGAVESEHPPKILMPGEALNG